MASNDIIDVTDATFAAEVLEESISRPVVVDFWAAWCAPCRALGPVLEKLAAESGGKFRLAKMDVDRNPLTPARFGVRGIPAVKAVVDRSVVAEFTGAYPEEAVRTWLGKFLPGPADALLTRARAAEEAGDPATAEAAYREALRVDRESREARLGLAEVLTRRGAHEEAKQLVQPLLPDEAAERVLARIRVANWANEREDGHLGEGKRLAAQGRYEEALEALVAGLAEHPNAAREAMLDLFCVLGDGDPLTRRFRPKLAAALF